MTKCDQRPAPFPKSLILLRLFSEIECKTRRGRPPPRQAAQRAAPSLFLYLEDFKVHWLENLQQPPAIRCETIRHLLSMMPSCMPFSLRLIVIHRTRGVQLNLSGGYAVFFRRSTVYWKMHGPLTMSPYLLINGGERLQIVVRDL